MDPLHIVLSTPLSSVGTRTGRTVGRRTEEVFTAAITWHRAFLNCLEECKALTLALGNEAAKECAARRLEVCLAEVRDDLAMYTASFGVDNYLSSFPLSCQMHADVSRQCKQV